MTEWVPLGTDRANYSSNYEHIEPWMEAPLQDWLTRVLIMPMQNGRSSRRLSLVQEFDSRSRRSEPLLPSFSRLGVGGLVTGLERGGYVSFLDFLVYKSPTFSVRGLDVGTSLEEILRLSGSAWTVGTREGQAGLERRVSEGVQAAADQAMATPGHAGTLLSEAWHAGFGLNPDYEKAYAKSVKAVEAAAIPVVSPNNTAATLGTVIGQMRADGDWSLDMTRAHSVSTPAAAILDMAQVLWTGQNDRHAGQPGYTPSTPAEAEAAVFLAVPLVQFFSSGAVARR